MSKKKEQTLIEEIFNAVTHGLGFIFFIVGTILLLLKANTAKEYVAVSLFSFGLLSLFVMSCLYHSFKRNTKVKRVFRIFDHSSIYLLIAGTYSPIWLLVLNNTLGLVSFIVMWSIACFGILTKVFFINRGKLISVFCYLVMGWCGVLVGPYLYNYNSNLLLFILLGGLLYSIGVAFYITRFSFSHVVWHFFVLGGAILHFLSVLLFVL